MKTYKIKKSILSGLLKRTYSLGCLHLFILALFVGCVAGEGGKKDATCPQGQNYDTLKRSCVGAQTGDDPPVPFFSSTSILEDSGVNEIKLGYSDSQNDFALSCTAESPTANGLVKQKINQSILYKSDPDIVDPHNTQVFIRSGAFFNVVADTSVPGIRAIIITVNSTTTTTDVASQINVHGTISSWIYASPLSFGNVTAINGSFVLDEIACACTGGECIVDLEPTTDFNGTSEFTYTLSDEDGQSVEKLALVNITSVNDNPSISVTGNITGAEESFNSGPREYKTGNLLTDGIISAGDPSDSDPTGLYLSVEKASNPTYGNISIASNGDYSYYTYAHEVSDSFLVRVRDMEDGVSSNVSVTVAGIVTVNDPPIGATPKPSDVLEDSGKRTINLSYTDEEADSAVSCEITEVNNVYTDGGCLCAAGNCSVDIAPLPDANGEGSFKYIIKDTAGNTPVEYSVSFNITAVDDDPIAFATNSGGRLEFMESDTYVPHPFNFSLDGAAHGDSRPISSYSIVSTPGFGTLSGCLGLSGSGLNCTYLPDDGNLSDSTTLVAIFPSVDIASVSTDTGTFHATTLGDTYDGLQIELIDIKGTDESISGLYGANAMAYYNNDKVTILFERGVTSGGSIASAVAANPDVSKIISFDASGGTQTSSGTLSLSFTGTNPKDSFVYRVTDIDGNTRDEKVYISIIPTYDRPTLCEYSSYADTTQCGLNGCIGLATPSQITPDKDGLVYYSLGTGACYESSAGSWVPVESHISDRSVNELDPIVIDNIRADEGGGGPEDDESLTITNVDSSDENLIPLGNIQFFYDDMDNALVANGSGHYVFGDGLTSADESQLRIRIIPQTINPPVEEKTSEIEITIKDSSGKLTEVVFEINVQKVSATHGGWLSFSATGPKVDSLGLVNEDRTVCPYSLDMCEGGQKCYGASSPLNSSFADPDHADAVYLQEAGGNRTCYRMKRTQVQNIAYVGKTSNNVSIEYLDNGAIIDDASVSVVGNNITVTINDDYTTTDTIISEIKDTAAANNLIKAINLKAGETQDAQSSVAINTLSNSNWESFETYCSVTPAALELGCNDGNRSSCVGQGPPSLPSIDITPQNLDSRYWDEENNTCYKSTGTSNSSDWIAYDAPAEVSISWNQFSINGSASIDEYRVYRRLSGEEYDFSLPINKETIAGTSATYTYEDNNRNSVVPPSPGTVYYYVVRPVVNGILTSTAAETGTNSIGEVRMMAPPKNMAFAHRWIINKTICGIMNRSTDAESASSSV